MMRMEFSFLVSTSYIFDDNMEENFYPSGGLNTLMFVDRQF